MSVTTGFTKEAIEYKDLAQPIVTTILYILYYRQGSNPHPQFTAFHHPSRDMKVISERAKRHCEVMGYRFVYVRPFIVDMDKEEGGHTS